MLTCDEFHFSPANDNEIIDIDQIRLSHIISREKPEECNKKAKPTYRRLNVKTA